MTNKAGMEISIKLHPRYIAGDLLWKNVIDLSHKNIHFSCKVYLPSVKCCSAAKQK